MEECPCRKPKPGLILEAQRRYGFEPSETFFVGDTFDDLEAAARAGCRPILVLTGLDADRYRAGEAPAYPPEYVAEDLPQAAAYILGACR